MQTNSAMQTASNWSAGSKPTSANDIGLTSSSTTLTNTAGTITGRSINVTNTNSYSIGNATGGATNSTLSIGVSGGFTNGISGTADDIIYLFNATTAPNLTISGANTGTGTGTLGITLNSSGNFNVASSGSTLSISSIISGSFGINKSGLGTAIFSGVNTYTGATTVTSGELRLNPSGNISLSGALKFNGGKLSTTGITSARTITFSSIDILNNSTLALLSSTNHTITFTSKGTFTSGKHLQLQDGPVVIYLELLEL